MTAVDLLAVHKRFGATVALHHLDLSIASGELISLLGPSGCGKTTALRILAGFEVADAGRIVVGGEDLTTRAPHRRDMGMVFQSYSLFPNLTVAGNVGFGLKMRSRRGPGAAARVAEMLELVGLGPLGDRYPHQLSGGQQQRVALARALAIEPRVLLLDEPLSALDAKVRTQLRDEIRRIQTELGTTTLFVTHDQEEALAISDRVGVMSNGRLEQLAPPAEVYARPANPFVARFVGSMNEVPAVVLGPGAVDLGAGHVDGLDTRGATPGERVIVLVRPEDVALDTLDADGAGGLVGSITGTTFSGPSTIVRVAVAGLADPIVVNQPTAVLAWARPGGAVRVTIRADRAWTVPVDDPALVPG